MMGNLKNTVDSIPILQYYGIDISDNLRVIKRSMTENGEPCTILYVNSGSLYNNSLKNQASVAHHAPLEDRIFMENNRVVNTSVKVLTPAIAAKMNSVVACGLEFDDGFVALELKEYEEPLTKDNPNPDKVFALHVHPLTITTVLGSEIYTHDPVVGIKFTKVTYRKNMRAIYNLMYMLFTSKELYYANTNSLETGIRCMEEIIRPYLDSTEMRRR